MRLLLLPRFCTRRAKRESREKERERERKKKERMRGLKEPKRRDGIALEKNENEVKREHYRTIETRKQVC